MTDTLGPYELRGELGRGAMAVVWRAWDGSLHREVALKEAHIPHGTPPEVAAELSGRFVREARAVAGLNHPGIVTVYSAEVYDERPVIAMEVIEGDTLSALLANGPLPTQAALGILDQLLDAIAYAHAKGIVHRDIKPDNIFVTPDGRVKLTDFGIAHVGSGTALTQAGTVMGTPGYMAPEQVTGQPVDARADIFSVGVVGYEMLTGANPFTADGAHPTTVMYRVLNEDLPDVRGMLPEAPESLAALLLVATAKDPAQRFESAEVMRAALRGDAAVVMPKPIARGSFVRRRYLMAGALALALLTAAGLWVFGSSSNRSDGSAGQGAPGSASVAGQPGAVTETSRLVAARTRVEEYISAVNGGRVQDAYDMRSNGYQAMNSVEGFASENSMDNWYAGGWSLTLGALDVSLAGTDSAFARGEITGYENREDPTLSARVSGLVFELAYESGRWAVVSVNASDG